MTNKSRKQSSLKLTQARKALAEARTTNDQRKISVAAANLGLALFRVNKFKEGSMSFSEVDRIFNELDDFYLQVHCLGIKTMAYQLSEQYPQAFQAAQEIERLAVAKEALAVQSDSLATQGQILINSGEDVFALEKLNAALDIAEKIDDSRRRMNATGALGNYCMAVAAPEQAESYFEKARDLAHELGDRQSEIGFHGNLGALLEWKGEHLQAKEIFEEVVDYMRETANQAAEIQALRHLTQIHVKMQDDYQIVNYAQQGIEAAKETDDDITFSFYEILVSAFYRLNKIDKAQQATKDVIEMVHSGPAKDQEKELNLLLSLGESYMNTNKLEQALETYQKALFCTQRLQRMVDRGYVLGRIGVILAELGRIDEALNYHEQAIELAQKHDVPELEGEQLVMLAMAHFENAQLDQARSFCETAVHVYTKAGLTEHEEKTRELLAKIV